MAASPGELLFPDAQGRMRSPEADPQKVLRHALARAGPLSEPQKDEGRGPEDFLQGFRAL
jgi:hypothetical protein